MTRNQKPANSEAYHREQIWLFKVYEKGNKNKFKQVSRVRSKTLEGALKQLRSRFPEDKYEVKYWKTEPIVSEGRKEAVKRISEMRKARAEYFNERQKQRQKDLSSK